MVVLQKEVRRFGDRFLQGVEETEAAQKLSKCVFQVAQEKEDRFANEQQYVERDGTLPPGHPSIGG